MNISRTDRQNKLTGKLTSNPAFNLKRKMMLELQGWWWRGVSGEKGSRPLCQSGNIIHRAPHVMWNASLTVVIKMIMMCTLLMHHTYSAVIYRCVCEYGKLMYGNYLFFGEEMLLKSLTFKRLQQSLNSAAAHCSSLTLSKYYINYILWSGGGGDIK